MKKLLFVRSSDQSHWVGDAFHVRTIFSYNDIAEQISPFLLMDYASPTEFAPSKTRRGVGEHPHRGFETVTIVYAGEVEHRDSAGGGGVIYPGDVQWMTAASGLVHEEKHGADFAKNGGPFEMVQLWVNLPKKFKMTKPRYQGLRDANIPKVDLLGGGGTLRVISGQYKEAYGPALTHSPINLWDIRAKAGKTIKLNIPPGHTTSLFVLAGKIKVDGDRPVGAAEFAAFDTAGDVLEFTVVEDAKILFLGGEPLNEPIVGYGPFVMNTVPEIKQAFIDFQEGRMGHIDPIEGAE